MNRWIQAKRVATSTTLPATGASERRPWLCGAVARGAGPNGSHVRGRGLPTWRRCTRRLVDHPNEAGGLRDDHRPGSLKDLVSETLTEPATSARLRLSGIVTAVSYVWR